MPVALQYKKTGGSVARLTQTFLSGEIFFDTDVDGFFVGDSATAGGLEVANADVTAFATTTQNVAVGDAGKLFVYSNSGGCAVALGQAGSSGGTYFPKQSGFWALNNSTSTVIITVTTSLINGVSTLTLNPDDSAVIVSDGTNYFALVTRAGLSVLTPIDITVIGNTTAVSSSGTVLLSGSTLSATGGVSAGYSASTLILSNPNVNATQNDTALGNTTASTSATTQLIGSSIISGAGDLSIGFSSSTLVFSAPAAATSTTAQNIVLLGNTTAATSSSILTLTNKSLSGAAGMSVGFSTTAVGAGVLIISQAPIGASATSMAMVAIGNTTGSTSSQTNAITGETYSVGGLLSAGFSNSTFVLSGGAGGSALLSYFEPRPLIVGSSSFQIAAAGALGLAPLNLPAQLSFNRAKFIVTYNFALAFGPNFTVVTTTTSDTLTGSCSMGHTFSAYNYSEVNNAQFSSVTSASISTGFSASGSASRSSNSISFSETITYQYNIDTNTSSFSVSASASSTAGFSGNPNSLATASFTGLFDWVVPLATTMGTGLNAIGIRLTSSTAQATMSTGASFVAMPNAPIVPFFYYCIAGGAVNIRTAPGAPLGGTSQVGRPFGGGFIGFGATYNPASLSTAINVWAAHYVELIAVS